MGPPPWIPIQRPLHTWASGCDHVLVKALDSHLETVPWEIGKLFFVETNMVCRNLCHACPLEVGLTQISADRETLIIVCHIDILCRFFIHGNFFEPLGLQLLAWSELDSLGIFDQWEILECNGHGPWVLCVKWSQSPCYSATIQLSWITDSSFQVFFIFIILATLK